MSQRRKPEGVGVDGRGARRRWSKSRRRQPVPYGVFLTATLLCFVGVIGICAVAYARIAQPYRHQAVQEAQIAQLKATMDADVAGNAQLQRQLDALNTQEGVETAARALRFVEPGEILLNVQATPAPEAPAPEDESFGARLKHAWDGLMGQ